MNEASIVAPADDPVVRRMAAICLVGFGGFLAWSGLAPLEEGVSAQGRVVVESERQVVQHLEGGIIRRLNVREGDNVNAGDPLVILEDTSSLATRDLVIKEYASLAASTARLAALQSGAAAPDFTPLDALALGAVERADIVERESSLFRQQNEARAADLSVLEARRDAARATQSAREREIVIVTGALAAAREEARVRRAMLAEQLVRLDQVTASEREAARLDAEIARLASEKQDAAALERDLTGQIAQSTSKYAETFAEAFLKTRAELLSAEERVRAAQDVLNRSVIAAPATGRVLNLRFATIGGVVRPGEALMEIIPDDAGLTASIRIRPTDRDTVFEGQTVRTQLSAFKSWRTPRLAGRIVSVSADLKTDPENSSVYYEARVAVPDEEIARLGDLAVIPGMPVDAFIYSGRSRTLLDYLLEPLGESLFRGLHSS